MADINITVNTTRTYKLREYMFTILDTLLTDNRYQVNANFLDNEIINYSLDRVPIEQPISENWIIPTKKYREVYEFRSRNSYGQDVMTNLTNIGFFEEFEDKIYSNNKKGVLPTIEGIESIECLNAGALNIANTQDAEFSILIQINYIREVKEAVTSL